MKRERERKRRFGVNAIISHAETSLSLSLFMSISLLRLYTFFLALTIGHYILFENACELQRVVSTLKKPLMAATVHRIIANYQVSCTWLRPCVYSARTRLWTSSLLTLVLRISFLFGVHTVNTECISYHHYAFYFRRFCTRRLPYEEKMHTKSWVRKSESKMHEKVQGK